MKCGQETGGGKYKSVGLNEIFGRCGLRTSLDRITCPLML